MTTNLPTKYTLICRNQEGRQEFMLKWGGLTEGIKPGDYQDGVILGFELNKYGKKDIIIRSLNHNGQPLKIYGCSPLEYELHKSTIKPDGSREIIQPPQLLFQPGDVIRVTYTGFYIGKKGISEGKKVSTFNVDELGGYRLTPEDVTHVTEFQKLQQQNQIQKSGLNVYQAQQPQYIPTHQPSFASGPSYQPQPTHTYSVTQPVAQPAITHYQQLPAQPSPRTFSPVSKEPFDIGG